MFATRHSMRRNGGTFTVSDQTRPSFFQPSPDLPVYGYFNCLFHQLIINCRNHQCIAFDCTGLQVKVLLFQVRSPFTVSLGRECGGFFRPPLTWSCGGCLGDLTAECLQSPMCPVRIIYTKLITKIYINKYHYLTFNCVIPNQSMSLAATSPTTSRQLVKRDFCGYSTNLFTYLPYSFATIDPPSGAALNRNTADEELKLLYMVKSRDPP